MIWAIQRRRCRSVPCGHQKSLATDGGLRAKVRSGREIADLLENKNGSSTLEAVN
jgi:hypothetical protein